MNAPIGQLLCHHFYRSLFFWLMLTRGRAVQVARAARVAVRPELARYTLAPLPRDVVAKIFLALPVDARLRCIEMCRAWRAFLADASLWEHLNLSIGFFSQNLLFAALLKAGAQLMTLDLTQRHVEDDERFENILRAARNLQKLRMASSSLCKVIESVRARLRAHPRLQVFETGVSAVRDLLEARRMLNCDSPYKPLRIRMLSVAVDSLENDAEKDAFLGEVQSHVSAKNHIWRAGSQHGCIHEQAGGCRCGTSSSCFATVELLLHARHNPHAHQADYRRMAA